MELTADRISSSADFADPLAWSGRPYPREASAVVHESWSRQARTGGRVLAAPDMVAGALNTGKLTLYRRAQSVPARSLCRALDTSLPSDLNGVPTMGDTTTAPKHRLP